MLLDESDAAFNGEQEYAEALRGQLNSGFHRSGKASACVGQGGNITYKDFSTFSPKAIAGIGKLPTTVESRSIPIALNRRTKDEMVSKWRRREGWTAADDVRGRLDNAGRVAVELLRNARPQMPEGLSDRAEDVLEPLFAIAEVAGESWPSQAQKAAIALMGRTARAAQEAGQNLALQLLADILAIFKDHGNRAALKTEEIITGLTAMEDRPWLTLNKNQKPITSHRLRLMLKDFGVVPAGTLRFGSEVRRGYRRSAFTDAFARYLPSEELQRNNANEIGTEPSKTGPVRPGGVADRKTAVSTNNDGLCSAVAPQFSDNGHRGEDDVYYYGA